MLERSARCEIAGGTHARDANSLSLEIFASCDRRLCGQRENHRFELGFLTFQSTRKRLENLKLETAKAAKLLRRKSTAPDPARTLHKSLVL